MQQPQSTHHSSSGTPDSPPLNRPKKSRNARRRERRKIKRLGTSTSNGIALGESSTPLSSIVLADPLTNVIVEHQSLTRETESEPPIAAGEAGRIGSGHCSPGESQRTIERLSRAHSWIALPGVGMEQSNQALALTTGNASRRASGPTGSTARSNDPITITSEQSPYVFPLLCAYMCFTD